jgi:cellulose synthase/poly-beta-1,6-N-acetylglucosamine synthase-like glycosyltransferase
VTVALVVFWFALAAIVWTHIGYPLFAALLARVAERPVRRADIEPTVAVIITAYNEEPVIAQRIENLLASDYPTGKLQIVVTDDASTDRTAEIALSFPGVRVISNPKGGKVAAQDAAVRQTDSEIVAFTDANSTWAPDALRNLVSVFADPEVAYVMGRLNLTTASGGNKEGVYWRYEVWLRAQESKLGSVTGGYGSIYALRRDDYVEVDSRFGHDLALPYVMVQRGRRAVFEPRANAFETPTPSIGTEYGRKIRMFEHCWLIVLRGRMLHRLGALYGLEIVSHRLLRYASGLLHVALLVSSIALVGHGWFYAAVLVAQLLLLLAALAGVGIARYYVLVTWATVVALVNYLRRGVPATWEPVRE